MNQWETSGSGSSLTTAVGLEQPTGTTSSNRLVKPTNNAQHLKYGPFYIKVTSSGGSNAFFGPFYVDVGCTLTSVTFTNSGSFATTGVAKLVGDSTASVYTMQNPTINRAWCTITSNEIVQSDGTTASTELVACAT